MATSSIFANFVIDDEESALRLVEAFEDFEKNGTPCEPVTENPCMSREEIRAFFAQGGVYF